MPFSHFLSPPHQLEEGTVVTHFGLCTQDIALEQYQQTFSEKGQRENTFGFVGHLVSHGLVSSELLKLKSKM